MNTSGVIFEHGWNSHQTVAGDLSPLIGIRSHSIPRNTGAARQKTHRTSWTRLFGLGMVALALGGLAGPMTPRVRLEAKYALLQAQHAWPAIRTAIAARITSMETVMVAVAQNKQPQPVAVVPQPPAAVPAVFDPLKTPDGASIDPINKDFSLVIPKIGVNAAVIPAVNPTKPGEYLAALQKGIAHSSLSYFPNEDGTVFLFSHSTNYDWFVGDLNAVFYLLKNLEEKDMVVLFYKGTSYTYRITGKQIVDPTAVSYMAPQAGDRRLILQTCWPPGSTTQRLLIFADLVETSNEKI